MSEIWKALALALGTALLTAAGTAWWIRADVLDALHERTTFADVEREVQRSSPYVRDREYVMKALRRHDDLLAELARAEAETSKALALLTGELRAYLRAKGNR